MKPDAPPLPAAGPGGRQRPLRYGSALVWIVALTVVGGSLAIRIKTGAIPENDDWSYVRSALEQHDSHRIVLHGFGQMFLIGQLTAAQPFLWMLGANVRTLDVFSAVAGVAWIWLVFLVARRLIGERRALLLVCVVAAWPALGLLSTSFMTDLPSTAAAWAALYFGIKAFETERELAMLASFVFAVLAFTVREQTIVVPIAVALFALIDGSAPRRLRYEAIGGGAATIAVCYVLERARHGLPHADAPPFGLSSFDLLAGVNNSIRGLFTLAFALSPLVLRFVILSRRRKDVSRGTVLGWVAGLGASGVLLAVAPHSVLLTNYVERAGAYRTAVVGTAPPVFDVLVWSLVQIVAIASTVVVAGEIGAYVQRRGRPLRALRGQDARRFILFSYAALAALLGVVLAFLDEHQYDRYLLPILPVVAVVLLSRREPRLGIEERPSRTRRRISTVGVTVIVAFLCLMSASLTLSTYVRDHAVWDAAVRLTQDGVPPTAINAGSAWNGTHAGTALDRNAVKNGNDQYPGDMWAQFFPRSSDCYVVSVSPMTGPAWQEVRTTSASPYGLGLGAITVYVYRRTDHRPFGPARC